MAMKLLTRDSFRQAVLARDGYKCIICGATGDSINLDAHHIIERRLFRGDAELGGYFVDNGATVCEPCHLLCEQTKISCEEVRQRCGITEAAIPEHLYSDTRYDKWGNMILPNGRRLRGEMFDDPGAQKTLAHCLDLFDIYVKYPRSYHLPWSPGATADDRTRRDLSGLEGQEVVVTLKMDGENTTFYRDYVHARSLEYAGRVDRCRVKALHDTIRHDIPDGWRVCGENVWAEHSIRYEGLPSTFMVFSVWNANNECLSWDETVEWAELLCLETVPVLERRVFDEAWLRQYKPSPQYSDTAEGYVVRTAAGFSYAQFSRCLAKFVRKWHVTTSSHWTRDIKPNGMTGAL